MVRYCRLVRGSLVATLLVLFSAAATADPVMLDTSVGTGADSYVRLGQATNNFGAASGVVIKDSGGGSTTRKGYLSFDVSAVDGLFSQAELTLEVSTNNSGGSNPDPAQFNVEVFGLKDGNSGEGWLEGDINWDNAPANAGSNGINNEALLLGSLTVPAEANPTVTFSDRTLASFLNTDSDGRATIILRRVGGGSANLAFASKENGGLAAPTISGEAVPAVLTTLTTADGSGADSFVQSGQADANFGGAANVVVKDAGSGTTNRKGYVRFDLSSINGPLVDAALLLDVALNNQGGGGTTPQKQTVNVFGLPDGDPGEAWDEMTLTWNNAPGNASNEGLDPSMIPLGSFTVPNTADAQVLFSSDELFDFITADTDGLATLVLTRETPSGSWNLGFGSKENGSFAAPSLRLAVAAAVPEPSTFILAALGLLGLGLVGWRRKRAA